MLMKDKLEKLRTQQLKEQSMVWRSLWLEIWHSMASGWMQLHQVDIVNLKHDLDPLKSPWDRKKLNCIVLQVENFGSFIIMGLKQEGRAQKGRS